MKNLFLVLLTTLLAFSSCDNSSSSNDRKGSGKPTTGNGQGTPGGDGKTDSTPVQNGGSTSDTNTAQPLLPGPQCEQQARFANHQFCTEYKINKETYLKILQFKSDCTFSATEYQMSNSQVMNSQAGSWKAQGEYLTLNTATAGSAIRKILGWYGDGIDLNNPSETYSFCD